MICKHCEMNEATRSRGLCWVCYQTPGVREKYGPVSKYGRRGVLVKKTTRLPPEPTSAMPGSPEKIAVITERVRNGYSCFHPADAQDEGDTSPSDYRRNPRGWKRLLITVSRGNRGYTLWPMEEGKMAFREQKYGQVREVAYGGRI